MKVAVAMGSRSGKPLAAIVVCQELAHDVCRRCRVRIALPSAEMRGQIAEAESRTALNQAGTRADAGQVVDSVPRLWHFLLNGSEHALIEALRGNRGPRNIDAFDASLP